MLIKPVLFCKLTRLKISSASLFAAFMSDFCPEKEICPFCGVSGFCRCHDSYERNLIDFSNGKTRSEKITVQRVICRKCRHTHAVLPDVMIPYRQYSLLFVLRVLMEYFLRRQTVAGLCDRFEITVAVLYRWRALFLRQHAQWLQYLGKLEQVGQLGSPGQYRFLEAIFPAGRTHLSFAHMENMRLPEPFLRYLVRLESFSLFLSLFSSEFQISFLQNSYKSSAARC